MIPISSTLAGVLVAITGGILSIFAPHDIALALVSGGLGMATAGKLTASR